MLLLALIENVQRADLNPMETAVAYQNLSENFGLTHEQIGQLVGKKRATVSNTLSLLNTSSKVQDAVRDSKFREGHANAIHTLPIQTQNAILDAHMEEYNFNVRQIETLSRYLREFPLEKQLSELKYALKKKLYLPQEEKEEAESPPQTDTKPTPAKAGITPEMEAVRTRLADHLSTKVTMRQDGEGGAVTFHFYSTEELNRILDLIFKE
jgi:ParB family chromosome partitioning protein